ncbi:unnamed protein product [Mucor hiemalis]
MSIILRTITDSKKYYMFGPKSKIYSCLAVLATYSADYPEQALLSGVKSWLSGYGCPRCGLERRWFRHGNDHPPCEDRDNATMEIYSTNGQLGSIILEKNAFNIDINEHWNFYDSLVIDDLHQIGGIYKHLLAFIEKIIKDQFKSTRVINERYRALPKFRNMRQFKSGYLLQDLVNPTYSELCNHMSSLLSVVHDLIPIQACLCIRAFLNFFIQVNSKEHTDATIALSEQFLQRFFELLPIFQQYSSSSLNFPKIHMITKYTKDILNKGPLNSYSTRHSERMHKTYAKNPFKQRNGHTDTFTSSLAKIIEDKDAFFDLYNLTLFNNAPKAPHFSLSPTNWPEYLSPIEQDLEYSLKSITKHTSFDSIMQDHPQLTKSKLRGTIRRYLHAVVDENDNRTKEKNIPDVHDTVIVSMVLNLTEFDDDGVKKALSRIHFLPSESVLFSVDNSLNTIHPSLVYSSSYSSLSALSFGVFGFLILLHLCHSIQTFVHFQNFFRDLKHFNKSSTT